MTKLTEDIYNKLLKHEGIDKSTEGNPLTAFLCKAHAEAVAEVCKGYIERAFDADYRIAISESALVTPEHLPHHQRNNWLKSEGITE